MQTVLHGRVFLICDDRGDVTHPGHGLFAHDRRYLTRWSLSIDGAPPQALGSPFGPHHCRTFVQRNAPTDALAVDTLLVSRELLVDDALYQRISIDNLRAEAVTAPLRITAATDFEHLFAVKEHEFERSGDLSGDVATAAVEPGHLQPFAPVDGTICARDATGDLAAYLQSTLPPHVDPDGTLTWDVRLSPRGRWSVTLRIAPHAAADPLPQDCFDERQRKADEQLARWVASSPGLQHDDAALTDAWRTSVEDLAALRIPAADDARAAADSEHSDARAHAGDDSMLPAAGLPWFMAVFGRDTAITCLQAMLLGATRAAPALANLAALQATADDPQADAEPGKILHEVREGTGTERGSSVYYGSIDSTPLFIVLLDELHRWTGDDSFVLRHREHALRALQWIERHGDLDSDGYLEYRRRSDSGLENQSWKDSWDSQRFHDGRFATGAIAPAEAQGYAYDARLRLARLARQLFDDEQLAARLEQDAVQLKLRFNRDFWVTPQHVPRAGSANPDDPRRDGFYALALDGDKQQVDSLTSNVGHLLWSGIVDDERASTVARQLVSDALHTGFGVRTMSRLDSAFNPLAYHNGTVWPHDTSLCIAGLVRYGHHEEAALLARGLFDAAAAFGGRLPEVFAGTDRTRTARPVPYPTTCTPQAWAAAAPVLVLTELLGIEPEPTSRTLRAREQPVPRWLEGARVSPIHAFGHVWQAHAQHGRTQITRR